MGGDAGSAGGPHDGQPVRTAGAPPEAATAAVVLLHGRGSTAEYVLRLIDEFLHHGVLYLAPQAAHRSWYPRSGSAPFEANEPWLSSALGRVSEALGTAADAGVPPERTVLLGFSQGAGVAGEFVARTPRRYGGLVVLSGSLLGPLDGRDVHGSIDGTPVFLGCGNDDPRVPADRVRDSARVFERLDGDVTCRLYPELGHEINDDEVRVVDSLVERLA